MKKALLSVLISLSSFLATHAQLTPLHTYADTQGYYFSVVDLSLSGTKYMFMNYNASAITTVVLYNLNHSIWKTINVPSISGLSHPGISINYCPPHVSENFFKIDNKVDMAMSYYDNSSGQTNLVIFDETGAVISRVDSVSSYEIYNIGTDSFVTACFWNDFDSTGTITKYKTKLFAVPGTLPCNSCGHGAGLGMPVTGGGAGNQSLLSLNIIPNPASSHAIIEYKIPAGATGRINIFDQAGRQVKQYSVDSHFDNITVDATDLPPGVYSYSLFSNGQSTAKKMVVVK